MSNFVLLDIQDSVATVTLNRPEIHNAFNDEVIVSLSSIFDDLRTRDDITVVILRGNGKSFSAGGDFNWMRKSVEYTEAENKNDALALARMLNELNTLPQVTIACVHGAAMGGGVGLMSCCDIVIADKTTKLALSEVKLGLIPATIGPYVIAAIGARQARRLFVTGERFSAQRGYDMGLVHELADDQADMDAILQKLLGEIAANGTHAMREAKRLCLDLDGRGISADVMDDTADRIAKIRVKEEAQIRLKNFLEKTG